MIEALLRLPLPLREVLVSAGTVKSRLSRGRERLAALLDPDASPAVPELVPDP